MIPLILVLALLGIALLIAEIFVPGGIIGILGVIGIAAAIGLALTREEVSAAGDWVPPTLVAGITIATVASVFVFMRLMRTKAMAMHTSLQASIRRPDPIHPSLVGTHGRTLTDLRPTGKIEIDGRRMTARAERGFIQADTAIEVLSLEFGEPLVRPSSPS